MKEESNKRNGLVHGPTWTTWPPTWLAERPALAAVEPPAAPLAPPVAAESMPAPPPDKTSDLAPVRASIDVIRRRDFAGKLPDSLARVAEIYIDLVGEYLARGESISGIMAAIDLAAANAMKMPSGLEER